MILGGWTKPDTLTTRYVVHSVNPPHEFGNLFLWLGGVPTPNPLLPASAPTNQSRDTSPPLTIPEPDPPPTTSARKRKLSPAPTHELFTLG